MKRPLIVPTKDYLCNYVINQIPFHTLRVNHYRRLGVKIGAGSTIFMSTYMHEATSITIGEGTIINSHCHLDGRGGLKIGNSVNISPHVVLEAGTHEVNDGKQFGGYAKAITVEDYVWLCTRATILTGVTIGRGAVVAAGAVVTRSVEPYAIVAGVPARKIGERTQDLHYSMANCGYSWH